MRKPRYFVFEPFRLDVLDERLWEREKCVPLGHKAIAVLECLLSQAGQLVTKDDLLTTAWPDTAVGEAVLTTAMREIRRALGDQARIPRFIQTVHGRGYRFIAAVTETSVPALRTRSARLATEAHSLATFHHPRVAASSLVGREAEWAQLHEWYATTLEGKRRIGFVAGEAGIGKTVLVEAFVSEIAAQGEARVGRGQCVQQYGAGEAYLPIVEALGRIARDGGAPIVELFRHYAPSWLMHLPSLAPGEEFQVPTPVTPERMLRELADALEFLTARDALILVMEDLHWSDTATLTWLAYIARRRDPARLMIVGTYRPFEVLLHKHPLRSLTAELRPHPQCPELVLDYLSREAVHAYVLQRCGRIPRMNELAEVLHRRTGGHPLFLATILDELVRQGILESANAPGFVSADHQAIASVIPASVRQFIEHRFEQLSSEEQTILEASSVAGDPFSVAAVAAATSLPEETIEACCEAWARAGQFLTAGGTVTWPDGTLAARYGFRHDLFREVVYARISPERRARLHQRIGSRLESAYGKRAAMIAAELAMHFDQGRDPGSAVLYLEQAARNALDRSAYSEAGRHLNRGQDLLKGLPEGRARLQSELELSFLLGKVLMATKGWAVAEVERVFGRARALCEELKDESRYLQATWGLMWVSVVRARFGKTQALAREMLALAKKRRDSIFRVVAHMELGGTAYTLGNAISARRHFREVEVLYNPRQHSSYVARVGVDVGLFSRSWESHFLWHSGYPDRARAKAEETVNLARQLSHPFTQAIALAYATMLNQFQRDFNEIDRLAKATITYTTEHGFPYYLAWAEVLGGWSDVIRGGRDEGIVKIRHGIEVLQTMAGLRLPYYRALLAEACGCSGRNPEALQLLADAIDEAGKTDELWWEAELHRLRGELLRSAVMNRGDEAEACFQTAIKVARGQQAKSLELRAAVSLGRLWRDKGKGTQARQLLAKVYNWFTEGFETHDLRDARSLLAELES
jgi:DNA-binding winged helix-turn-helix (wHTH) protein/predicted ATPase